MSAQSSYGLREYINRRWPYFFLLYAALILSLLLIGLGLTSDWYALIPFSLAIMLVSGYFLVTSIWIGRQIYGNRETTPSRLLLKYSQLEPTEKVACIDLGLRETPIDISRLLTIGTVTAIDVFNPQSNTNAILRRGRYKAERPISDPRVIWVDGNIDLLPLPNNSVTAVYMAEILSEFWLPEERQKLLDEVWRILLPEGRLMIAERVKTHKHPFFTAIQTYTLSPVEYWRSLITRSDFTIQREFVSQGLIYCVRATKPNPASGKQMKLELKYN